GTMVYDSARAQVVMFGRPSPWAWDGLRWTEISGLGPPPDGAVAYDSLRDRLILLSNEGTGETWQLAGGVWSLIRTAGPAAFAANTLVYDELRDRVMVFSGPSLCGDQTLSRFDGTGWTHTDLPFDFTRSGEAMAYDSDTAESVMFGGLLDKNVPC